MPVSYTHLTIEMPPPGKVVEVPINAVVEDGRESVVFVQPDADKPVFTQKRVWVTDRFEKVAFVRSSPPDVKQQAAEDDVDKDLKPAKEPLREGERVLTCGTLELRAALADLLAEQKSKQANKK